MQALLSVMVLALCSTLVAATGRAKGAKAGGAVGYDSTFDLDQAERYVALCGVAYCTDPKLRDNCVDKWSCNACKQFPNMTATSFKSEKFDGNGFVGYDATADEVVVSFSGTDPLSIRNWLDDLVFVKEDYPYCDSCQVHSGFYATYQSLDPTVKSLVTQYLSKHPSASLSVTGHSLGAALALLCVAELVQSGYIVRTAYTYGMPRVGDDAFQVWVKGGGGGGGISSMRGATSSGSGSSGIAGVFRVTHRKDPVPHLPPMSFGFRHIPYEAFYIHEYEGAKEGEEKERQGKGEGEKEGQGGVVVCDYSGEDPNCSDQYSLDLFVPDHLNYLGFDFTTNYLSCSL
ncbi:Alpha/Beta hydrolase protein [Ochromonadaceae sp. CCMP2298]|nr:Alpha/Beta hydrolase protein [Ochromonadaceae sp. CCMP2298]